MLVNPNKFQAIIISKKSTDEDVSVDIGNNKISPSKTVKLLGLTIDNKLYFEKHVSICCRQASAQLNALIRLNTALHFKQRKALIESFIMSNFYYCPLVWHFCSAKASQKIENVCKRALRFAYSDYDSTYEELLGKSKKNHNGRT